MPIKYSEKDLQKVDLTNQVLFDDMIRYLEDSIIHNIVEQILETDHFFDQWWLVHPNFVTEYPDRAQALQLRIYEARWVILPALTEPEKVLDLFEHRLSVLFHINEHYQIPIEEQDYVKEYLTTKLRDRLLLINVFDERDAFKKTLLEHLVSSSEVITTAPFYRGIKQAPATVKNWFSEYVEFFSHEPVLKIKQREFFNKNDNVKRLNPEEKKWITLLVNAYEQLHISSWKESGVEDPVDYEGKDGKGVLQYGKVQLDDPKITQHYHQMMKDYKELLLESGVVNPEALNVESRPPVAQVGTGSLQSPLQTTGPNLKATAGPDHFSESDADDIAQYHTTNNGLVSPKDYTTVVEDIKKYLQLTFTSPDIEKKFTAIVLSVLRGLRDTMELSSYLKDMSYSQADIDRITQVVDETAQKYHTALQSSTESVTTHPSPTSAVASGTTPVDLSEFEMTEDAVTQAKVITSKKSFLPKLRRSKRSRKPIIDDVKIQASMIMGPIDELRSIDIIEFRRLASDPAMAADKLKHKIMLLAEESVSKQSEGIQAFKTSPLNTMYLDIGNQSITSGRSVSEVITDLQTHGGALTQEEFNAIADLNKQLRF